METTLGGNRLGSGGKNKVSLQNYQRSTHQLDQVWRSSMASGTLVPFMKELALPGDSFDIKLNAQVLTLPTVGPLFGNFKVQLDVFTIPIRIYNGAIMQNQLNVGMAMQNVYLPQLYLSADTPTQFEDLDNSQINPSCILSYLDIRGLGARQDFDAGTRLYRAFNAVPFIAYWDIYKNYYANKQEEEGVIIHTDVSILEMTIESIEINTNGTSYAIPSFNIPPLNVPFNETTSVLLVYTGTPNVDTGYLHYENEAPILLTTIFANSTLVGTTKILYTACQYNSTKNIRGWGQTLGESKPKLVRFPLSHIDDMRSELRKTDVGVQFTIPGTPAGSVLPYVGVTQLQEMTPPLVDKFSKKYSQEGLGIKTYQSDLFNNWLSTEWIDGDNGINNITSIDTSSGEFSIDTLNLSKKIYDMLNRIAISGGTYDDWLDATYSHDRRTETQNPVYVGGLSKELTFQEVVSTTNTPDQPLGTLAGRGVLTNKNKGGNITIRVDEPSYIMGIVSLTPRIDYSQGNKWDTGLQTFNDFHKPALDEIGFQDLITDQMAWWDTRLSVTGQYIKRSAGKQPAWVNYMTNVNVTRGNFAFKNKEMFMTLNRRYEPKWLGNQRVEIKDLTTYIDPTKYNNIFAETRLDAQNFWVQIASNITARRKMSAKIIPNL